MASLSWAMDTRNYSVVTLVCGRPTIFVQLPLLAIFGQLHSMHPCCLLAASGPLEGSTDASRESQVMWDTFLGWCADDLKFEYVQILRRSSRRRHCRLIPNQQPCGPPQGHCEPTGNMLCSMLTAFLRWLSLATM